MNKMKKTVFAALLVACAASAFAAPNGEHKPEHSDKPCSHMMPPPPPPIYAVTQQTDSPKEALNSAVQNAPALEKGKHYEIRMEIKELPPVPHQAPDAKQ